MTIMRILLISPINRTYVVMPMLGLMYLASIARKEHCQVDIMDCKKEKMVKEVIRKKILIATGSSGGHL